MSDSEIERGIPIPSEQRWKIEDRFPEIMALEVGDSFLIPKDKSFFPIHISVALYGIKNSMRHEVRKINDGDYRVWRTA